MTIEDLYNILVKTNYPVAYSHFTKAQTIPFITYLVVGTENFFADDKVYQKINEINIELYTDKKDLEIEKKLESILEEHGICFDVNEVWIEKEKLYKRTYEMEL